MNLNGSTAIVTGASQGIGRAIAEDLGQHGCNLVLASRNFELLREVAEEIRNKSSGRVLECHVDVTNEQDVIAMVDSAVKSFGRIDLLINNAGYAEPLNLLEISLESWNKTVGTNLTGTFLCTREVVRHMKNYGGKIINVSSTAGITPRPGWSAYAASKAALVNFSLSLAEELSEYNIRVYCIAPGRTATKLRSILAPDEDQTVILQADSIARIVRFLVSDEGDFLEGQSIIIKKR